MNAKRIILYLSSLLILIFLSSCGNSEYYDKGYKSGYSHGQSDVRNVLRITEPSKHGYISSGDFDAYTAYDLLNQSPIWGPDESYEYEWKNGFIDGYNDGVKEQLKERGLSTTNSKSHSSSTSHSNSETGIKWWQWIIIFIVTSPILNWLGVFENEGNEEGKEKKPVILVNPWKSFFVVIFALIYLIIIYAIFNLRVNNWSTYFVDLQIILALSSAYKNSKIWTLNYGKSFLCAITKFLSVVFIIYMSCNFFINLYTFFTE